LYRSYLEDELNKHYPYEDKVVFLNQIKNNLSFQESDDNFLLFGSFI